MALLALPELEKAETDGQDTHHCGLLQEVVDLIGLQRRRDPPEVQQSLQSPLKGRSQAL